MIYVLVGTQNHGQLHDPAFFLQLLELLEYRHGVGRVDDGDVPSPLVDDKIPIVVLQVRHVENVKGVVLFKLFAEFRVGTTLCTVLMAEQEVIMYKLAQR